MPLARPTSQKRVCSLCGETVKGCKWLHFTKGHRVLGLEGFGFGRMKRQRKKLAAEQCTGKTKLQRNRKREKQRKRKQESAKVTAEVVKTDYESQPS